MKNRTSLAVLTVAAATSIACTWSAATTAGATPMRADLPGNDCAVIRPISSSAIAKLAPLQTLPPDQAHAAMNTYIGELRGAQQNVGSAKGKADLSAYISALQNATGPSSGAAITGALGTLRSDCP